MVSPLGKGGGGGGGDIFSVDEYRKNDHQNYMNENDENDENDGRDLFGICVTRILELQEKSDESDPYYPVMVDSKTLLSLNRDEVYVSLPFSSSSSSSSSSSITRAAFYLNVLPDIPIAISQPCNRFFYEEELELALLKFL